MSNYSIFKQSGVRYKLIESIHGNTFEVKQGTDHQLEKIRTYDLSIPWSGLWCNFTDFPLKHETMKEVKLVY